MANGLESANEEVGIVVGDPDCLAYSLSAVAGQQMAAAMAKRVDLDFILMRLDWDAHEDAGPYSRWPQDRPNWLVRFWRHFRD